VPCGIKDVIMTSVARELGRSDPAALWFETRQAVIQGVADALDLRAIETSRDSPPVSFVPLG
jgi:hypothetical protein